MNKYIHKLFLKIRVHDDTAISEGVKPANCVRGWISLVHFEFFFNDAQNCRCQGNAGWHDYGKVTLVGLTRKGSPLQVVSSGCVCG